MDATHPAHIFKITNAQALSFAGSEDRLLVSVDWRKENVSFRLVDAVTGNILANDRGDESGKLFGGPVLDVSVVTRVPHQDKFAWASNSLMGVGDGGFGTLLPLHCDNQLQDGDYDSVAVSGDGRLGAFGSHKGEIELRNSLSTPLQPSEPLRGHLRAVTALAFTSRGTRLISGSEDGSIRIWDLKDRRELLLLRTGSAVRSVAMSPDGRTLAAGLDDGTVHFWVAPGAPPN